LHDRLEWKETNLRLPWIRESYASAMHVGLAAALPAGDVRMRRNMWGRSRRRDRDVAAGREVQQGDITPDRGQRKPYIFLNKKP
jgi:hypothetical protein